MEEPRSFREQELDRFLHDQLNRIEDRQVEMGKEMAALGRDFAALKAEFKVKAGFFGMVAGAVPVFVMALWKNYVK
jgi:hypothetical protein